MRILNKVFLLAPVLALGACGYAVESSNQDITFLTPGAEDARCEVFVDGIKYKVFPPQVRNIKKSENDMQITCYAPGNRVIEIEVAPSLTKRAIWGGPPGMAWDFASKSLFYYPSVIAVDFSLEPLVPNELPAHNNSDIRQPESYDLDEILPSEPRLNSDKYKVETPLARHGDDLSDVSDDMTYSVEDAGGEDMSESPAVKEGDKGDLQSVIENLTSDNDGQSSDTAPVSLYPGQ